MAVTIDGTNGITSPDFEPSSSTTPTNGLFLPTTNAIGFATNSTERLRLDASGNLGLGVTPSGWVGKAFEIGYAGSAIQTSASGYMRIMANTYQGSGGNFYYAASATKSALYEQNTGQHIFYTAGTGTAGAAISFTQAMTLDASGNLLLNATSAFGKLSMQVAGTTTPTTGPNISPSSVNLYAASNGGSTDCTTGIFGWNTANTGIGSGIGFTRENGVNWGTQIRFYVHPTTTSNIDSITEAARIDSSGNLLVGTTSSSAKLYVVGPGGSGYANGLAWIASNAASDSTYTAMSIQKYDNVTTTSQKFVTFLINQGAAASGYITANGANAATFTSSSDARLKENITALPNQLANICALKPSEFDYKDGTGHQIGFIAQEMQEVYPDCVDEDDDGMLMISGWSKTEARLVKAIQELTQRLEKLENKNG